MNVLTITQLQKLDYVLQHFGLPDKKRLKLVVSHNNHLLTGSFYDMNLSQRYVFNGSPCDVLSDVCQQARPNAPIKEAVIENIPAIFAVLISDVFIETLDKKIHCNPRVLPPMLYNVTFLESGFTLPFYGFSATETLPLVSLLLESGQS